MVEGGWFSFWVLSNFGSLTLLVSSSLLLAFTPLNPVIPLIFFGATPVSIAYMLEQHYPDFMRGGKMNLIGILVASGMTAAAAFALMNPLTVSAAYALMPSIPKKQPTKKKNRHKRTRYT